MGLEPVIKPNSNGFVARTGSAAKLNMVNNCAFTVWPAIVSNTEDYDGVMKGMTRAGLELGAGLHKEYTLPADYHMFAVWARTGCDANFECETGDCGPDKSCTYSPGDVVQPKAASIAELILPSDAIVSYASGRNVNVTAEASGGDFKVVFCADDGKGTPGESTQRPATTKSAQRCAGGLTDSERSIVEEEHNKQRSDIAQGRATNKGGAPLPKAKNMYKLKYDCAAEALAQQAANSCSTRAIGAKLNFLAGGEQSPSFMIKQGIQVWFHKLSEYGIGNDLKFSNPSLYYWAEAAYASNTKIGCAVKYCQAQGFTVLVCQYQPAEIPVGGQVYQPGNPCKNAAECTTYPKSTCEADKGLCVTP
ncbi:venom allergen-like protein vap-2 [Aphelenchoides avenae]|nr:venom allergen-like protein vap-2 [Aphelenchus avenae]